MVSFQVSCQPGSGAHEQRSGHNVEQVESLVRSHKDIKQAQRADAYYLGQ